MRLVVSADNYYLFSDRPPLEWQREVPILILDCEKDFENDVERQQCLLKEVQQYVNRLDDINNT